MIRKSQFDLFFDNDAVLQKIKQKKQIDKNNKRGDFLKWNTPDLILKYEKLY